MSLNTSISRSSVCLMAALFSVILFTILTVSLISFDTVFHFNSQLSQLMQKLDSSNLDKVMILVSLIGDKYIIIPTATIAGMIFWFQGQKRLVCHLFGVILLATLSAHVLKNVIAYPRPGLMTEILGSFAFPSRHITISTAYLVFLYSILVSNSKNRIIGAIGVLLLIIVESFSRILLDAHWFTDILGGLFLGATCGFLGAYNFFRKPYVLKDRLLIIKTLILVFIFFSCAYTIFFWQQMVHDYIQ